MEQLKFTLGPYEFFAAIIGGSPLVIAIFLLLNPIRDLNDFFLTLSNQLSIPVVVAAAFCSYLLGGAIQGVSWRYFLFCCGRLHKSYRYFGDMIALKNAQLPEVKELAEVSELEFEDKLVLLLRQEIGIPQNLNWLDARLMAYLKEMGSQALVTAELHLVNHIMYRNLSINFLILSAAFLLNLLRVQSSVLEQIVFIVLLLLIAYLTFFRSLSFKKWQNRELLLGFYFSVCHRSR
jgi:hypothetical protein